MPFLNWLKSLFSRKAERPLDAFVWLLDEPRMLDAETVRRVVERALGVAIPSEPGDDATSFVVGEPPSVMVKLDDQMLLVNSFPVPYLKDPKRAAKDMGELRVRKILLEHRAWISADLLGEYDGDSLREGLRRIGRIAAELADSRCLALYVPRENQLIPFDPDLLEKLRQEDPLGALGWGLAPVVTITNDHPEMKAAVAEARRRWPEFVAAFQNPRPDQRSFAVKLPITSGANTEFIWVEVASIDGHEILGDLANEPVDLPHLHEGSRVRGKLSDLNDWAYIQGDELIGGFTSAVLLKAHGRGRSRAGQSRGGTSIRRSRSGSTRTLISTILPSRTAKAVTRRQVPGGGWE
jgi:uncharacterized protein YegJ (DUF2314 family)